MSFKCVTFSQAHLTTKNSFNWHQILGCLKIYRVRLTATEREFFVLFGPVRVLEYEFPWKLYRSEHLFNACILNRKNNINTARTLSVLLHASHFGFLIWFHLNKIRKTYSVAKERKTIFFLKFFFRISLSG